MHPEVSFITHSSRKFQEVERLLIDSKSDLKLFSPSQLYNNPANNEDDIINLLSEFVNKTHLQLKHSCFAERRFIKLEDGKFLDVRNVTLDEIKNLEGKKGSLDIVVVLCSEGNTQTFKTTIEGQIKSPEKPSASDFIEDQFWIPKGFKKSLAQLGEHLCLQNEPYLSLADKLRRHKFEGIMEIHIFVAPLNPSIEIQERFKKCCIQEGMKCCNLKLDFVKHGFISVLMSSRYVRGTMDTIWRETFKDARILAALDFDVVRTKIEATASIDGVPATDVEALDLPKKTYFEFHMVFANPDGTAPSDEKVAEVKKIAKGLEKEWNMCIPLSTNAFGTQKFLNMRTYGIGRENSFPRLEMLGKHIEVAGVIVPRFIREFGVYDSDVTIDCGWLEPLPGNYNPGDIVGFLPPIAQ